MKICLYSPYVPKHFGGGEKYFFDVAVSLRELGHSVNVAISNRTLSLYRLEHKELQSDEAIYAQIASNYEKFFEISLKDIVFIKTPIGSEDKWKKLWWTKQFDLMYAVTDGSLFLSLAKKNILHIQVPFTSPQQGLLNRLKLLNWCCKNANSIFTQKIVEKSWKTSIGFVHYPMINEKNADKEILLKKKKSILTVGRFFRQLHAKKQDILINIFRDMINRGSSTVTGWKLILVGGVEDYEYVKALHEAAAGYPIEFVHQADKQALTKLYDEASIYWHAAGYGEDEAAHPEKIEHFGISTVEAMAHGCVPIVVGKGGQKEILSNFESLTWQTSSQCREKTLEWMSKLSSVDSEVIKEVSQLRQSLISCSQSYSPARFRSTLKKMIDG